MGVILALVFLRYLMAGVELPDGTCEATPQGVPQGGPLSPLLASIVLDPLDKELESRGHKFARYADDFIVLVKSANAAKRVLASLVRYCEGRLSQNEIVRFALNNRWLEEQGVPDLRAIWIVLHHGPQARV